VITLNVHAAATVITDVTSFVIFIKHLKQSGPARSLDGSYVSYVVVLFSPTTSLKYTFLGSRGYKVNVKTSGYKSCFISFI
jgi:hypothetical protein